MTLRPLLVSLSLFALSACGPAVSKLSEINTKILGPKCALSGCHTGGTNAAQGLDLSTDVYNKLVNANSTEVAGKKLVVANNVASSFLYEKITKDVPSGGGTRMPSTPPYLTQAEVDQITSWINSGAPNN